ncbi:MAG: hypothetical protein Q8P68_06445 [Candidatus Peregrinibacteria bacterium]|nr:hypothetical protein [Candidatus Peregrinibacteria bacterium]MDZ4244433.1 hypothetical protein [Candidatus Gracilibacteria bacterium]
MKKRITIQRGVEFLKIVLSELSDPQVLKLEKHPYLPHMWDRMQDKRFDSRSEPFEYRSKHFPRFMKSLYLKNTDIPDEFKDYADSGMVFDLLADFVKQCVIAGTLNDVLTNENSHEREYMFFCFKFFAAIEDQQIEKISTGEGTSLSTPSVLAEKPDGTLEVLTGADLEARKANKKTDIVSMNPFGDNDIDTMMSVCAKKGEMSVISHLQDGGFEIMDIEKTDRRQTKIIAENKETSQKIEVYTDKFGVPEQFVDTVDPSARLALQGTNWRDELGVQLARAGKNPDMIAKRAEVRSQAGAPKSEPLHPKISTGNLSISNEKMNDIFGNPGHERFEQSDRDSMSSKEFSEMPTKTKAHSLPFAPLPKSSQAISGKTVSHTIKGEENDEPIEGGITRRGGHRRRLTESGEATGQIPGQSQMQTRKKEQEQPVPPKPKKKKMSAATKVMIGTAAGSVTGVLSLLGVAAAQ